LRLATLATLGGKIKRPFGPFLFTSGAAAPSEERLISGRPSWCQPLFSDLVGWLSRRRISPRKITVASSGIRPGKLASIAEAIEAL
jgi:hypothetical protein